MDKTTRSAWILTLAKTASSDQTSSFTARTRAVVTATKSFLDLLSPEQRAKVQFPFSPQPTATAAANTSYTHTGRWSRIPAAFIWHRDRVRVRDVTARRTRRTL